LQSPNPKTIRRDDSSTDSDNVARGYRRTLGSDERSVKLLGQRLVRAREQMAVAVKRDRDGRVTEHLLHHLRVRPGGDGQAGAGMAQVVESQPCLARRQRARNRRPPLPRGLMAEGRRLPTWKGKSLPPWGKCSKTGEPHIGAVVLCRCGARRPYSLEVAQPRQRQTAA
jgi:hypothetical protein